MRSGFSLIELLLFATIFFVISIVFVSILVVIVRIQARQNAVAEVNQQSQFLLQTIQRHIEEASLIDMSQDSPQSELKLRKTNSAFDPTYLCLGIEGGFCTFTQCACGFALTTSTVYVKETDPLSAPSQQLTSNKVKVTALEFVKRRNSGGHDSLDVSFSVEHASDNPQQKFSQTVHTSIARSGAAVFDTHLDSDSGFCDSTTCTLGTWNGTPSGSFLWSSINDLMYFASSSGDVYIGIGTPFPGQKLEVNGGLRISPKASDLPSCNFSKRGTLWVKDGTPDVVQSCLQMTDDSYSIFQLYP